MFGQMADFTAVAAQTFPVSKGKICVLEQRYRLLQ